MGNALDDLDRDLGYLEDAMLLVFDLFYSILT